MSSDSSWLKSHTYKGQLYGVEPQTLAHHPNRNFCLMHFQVNGWQDNAACIQWKQHGTTHCLYERAGLLHVCFPVGYACACTVSVQYLSMHQSMCSLFPLQLSECQAALSTWISRSLPHAHLLLHTPLISVPLQRERLHSCKLSQDFSYSIMRC